VDTCDGTIDDVVRSVLVDDDDDADKMPAKPTTKPLEFEGDDHDGARATATSTEIGVVDRRRRRRVDEERRGYARSREGGGG